MKQPSLFDDDGASLPAPSSVSVGPAPERAPDQEARDFAVDPEHDVVLEASAGTGKTRVLVDRYVRLIEKGVDPRHILAITFTRKAAAEMRERVLAALVRRAEQGGIDPKRWHALRQRISDIQISTIDAFCFSLLREFPLEAGVEPGFDIADETEMGRFAREAMERTLRISRALLPDDEALRLLFARVKGNVLRGAVEEMLDRRHIALPAVADFVKRSRATSSAGAADDFLDRLRTLLGGSSHRAALLEHGPDAPEFRWLQLDLMDLDRLSGAATMARVQQLRRRLESYFLTQKGTPRLRGVFKTELFAGKRSKELHDAAVVALAPSVKHALDALEIDVNTLLARGLLRLLGIASSAYDRLLEEHGLLDFAGMLDRAVGLLSQQEEFARSRLKLQARYHHVLVDEFQDTSRPQWRLIEHLVDAWGEGEGGTDAATSIFIVGDRKQSIYRFRHAEVTLLDEAARKISALRRDRPVRQAITKSFRAVPELLSFVNALAEATQSTGDLPERFTYTDQDRFPSPGVSPGALRDGQPVLGLIAEPSIAKCAAAVASEIEQLIGRAVVRGRDEAPRFARPDDIAILFRVRAGHQLFETALEARNIRTYVYKGLGFFDAPEVQDLQALLRVLAQPDSDLRAAEFLRSRFMRVSDVALTRLAPALSDALVSAHPSALDSLDATDRALIDRTRADLPRWLGLADRLPPSAVGAAVRREAAYAFETRGRRVDQARENIKKVQSLIRRVESRGYATLGRIAEYFETLKAGDESHAILEAAGCVNLMTMHAAKGLEFPIVFLVNLQAPGRGRSAGFTIVERGPAGEPEVAFNSNAATKLEDDRDTEELRRLMYVGVTRARDRLYLASQVDPRQQLRRTGRSLASLLPQSLGTLFQEAASNAAVSQVTWLAGENSYTFRVCRPAEQSAPVAAPPESLPPLDVEPLAAGGRAVFTVASKVAAESSGGTRPVSPEQLVGLSSRHRVIGTIVHRLLQLRVDPTAEESHVESLASGWLALEDRLDVLDWREAVKEAIHRYKRLRSTPDFAALLDSGEIHFEVPYSFVAPGSENEIVRGVIDCLIMPSVGAATVLEFKTGAPRAEHDVQGGLYQAAIREILARNDVAVKILYV